MRYLLPLRAVVPTEWQSTSLPTSGQVLPPPSRNISSGRSLGEESDARPHALSEELVSSDDTLKPTLDPINQLLAYPTLYEPIRKPRNPVVLCHGLYGFDTWGLDILPALRIHYWADVLDTLRNVVGISPVITSVPGTGSIKLRAETLHKALQKEVKGKEINFMAHSMGGLDCRHLLTHIRPNEYTPLSLTTIATPHRGSHFMAWCRNNIGIGDVAAAAAAAAVSPTATAEALDTVTPYSLKTPLLTRKQREEAAERALSERSAGKGDPPSKESPNPLKRSSSESLDSDRPAQKQAITQTLLNIPGLNYSVGTSLASYLLDLLDSPAYSNLTPEFLEKNFNPSTPDREGVRYFSIAARTPKLSVTHPLWLPKVILDKAEEIERSRDQELGRIRSDDWKWGNDGLVPVYSAKWGEYLGCVENADHWAIRGGSGLKADMKAAANTAAKAAADSAAPTTEGVTASSSAPPSKDGTAESTTGSSSLFGWQDLNSLVGKRIDLRDSAAKVGVTIGKTVNDGEVAVETAFDKIRPSLPGQSATPIDGKAADVKLPGNDGAQSLSKGFSSLTNLASWIVKRIPMPTSSTKLLRSSINPAYPFDDSFQLSTQTNGSAGTSSSSNGSETRSARDTARLLFGSVGSKLSSKSAAKAAKFNRERFYVAVCRKLYDEGL